MALVRLLLPLCRAAGVTPVVLHFDHGLRGATSATDARFVTRLAKKLDVLVEYGQWQTTNGKRQTASASLEMNAREARQTFFRAAARKRRLDAIATGHTADDVAETLLLRLARGSGATGLSGLRPCHTIANVRFVRPLLGCGHEALRVWLRTQRQPWREDASNLNECIPRNRIRHTILPWLEKNWSPSIRTMLVQSASILRDEDALLESLARMELNTQLPQSEDRTIRLPAGSLSIAIQRRILRQWLLASGCAAAAGWDVVEGILIRNREQTTWQMSLPGGGLVRAAEGVLRLVTNQVEKRTARENARPPKPSSQRRFAPREDERLREPLELKVPGHVDVADVRVTARSSKGIVRSGGPVGGLPSSCSLDAEALRGKTLLVRTRRAGDRIQPLGLAGSKKLQDLFVDAKLPAAQRDQLPLLVVADEVVWLPGYRVAQKYAVRGPRMTSVRVDMKVIGH